MKLMHSMLNRQSHTDQGIVVSARLVLMENYLLELTIKLCLDHKTLAIVYYLSPEFNFPFCFCILLLLFLFVFAGGHDLRF